MMLFFFLYVKTLLNLFSMRTTILNNLVGSLYRFNITDCVMANPSEYIRERAAAIKDHKSLSFCTLESPVLTLTAVCLLLTFPQSAAFLPGLCSFSTPRHTSYPLRSADSADDKHLFSCSLYLRSLAWNSLAASVVIMVCYSLRGRDETESSAWGG